MNLFSTNSAAFTFVCMGRVRGSEILLLPYGVLIIRSLYNTSWREALFFVQFCLFSFQSLGKTCNIVLVVFGVLLNSKGEGWWKGILEFYHQGDMQIFNYRNFKKNSPLVRKSFCCGNDKKIVPVYSACQKNMYQCLKNIIFPLFQKVSTVKRRRIEKLKKKKNYNRMQNYYSCSIVCIPLAAMLHNLCRQSHVLNLCWLIKIFGSEQTLNMSSPTPTAHFHFWLCSSVYDYVYSLQVECYPSSSLETFGAVKCQRFLAVH